MGKIEHFEQIESWKLARELTKEVYRVTSAGPFARDFGLKDQMRRQPSQFFRTLPRDSSEPAIESSFSSWL
jgi:hypothetical protein